MPFSTYLGNKVLTDNLISATGYMSLHTGDPGLTGANEVTGGSYSRKACAVSAPSGKATSNSGTITFTGMPTATVTYACIWDAASAGNCLLISNAFTAVSVTAGNDVKVDPGGATFAGS